ncbi:MAG: class I SAM-dependent RNA methyltransferase, partial [Acidimicrobiales bacterium]|nr:class I SAM-dependent RNA methyltransferase [Acidimicrobiales bacterium]
VGTIGGRASYFLRGTKHLLPVDACPVAHPLVEELIVDGRFGIAADVMIRVGARTGDRMVVVGPTADDVLVPDDVLVVGADELKARKRAWITERAAGHTFRVSARSFFQARPDGADALVEAVHRHLGPVSDTDTIADLYGGVGLFAASMPEAAPITLVESSPSAVADAKYNLADHNVRVVKTKAEKWTPDRTDIVIADPSREGLHPKAAQRISQTRSDRVVLVSCDPAAMARDVGELGTYGLKLQALTIVDLFPQTSHIETVASFSR